MQFDARTAKLLAPGAHITIDGYPGLRLTATESTRRWVYRYKSPIDDKMRQIKLGEWPKTSLPGAIVEWEKLSALRKEGKDPSLEKKSVRTATKLAKDAEQQTKRDVIMTVGKVCSIYWEGHIKRNRKKKGADEVQRTFDTMLGDHADRPVSTYTRRDAFDLLERHLDIPVQCSNLRRELGAAWDYCLDAGKLPETTPNWWRSILRGKIKSKGKTIQGERIGTKKRVLSQAELVELLQWMPNFGRNAIDVLTLYLWTAARGAEIVAMDVSEFSDEDDGLWWTLPKHKTKNANREDATDHRVPIIGRAMEIVRRRIKLARNGWLFWSQQRPTNHIQQKTIQEHVWFYQPYCTIRPESERPRLPVTHWGPHDLRRTSRTLLAAIGCPDEPGEAIVGHMLPGVKGIYNLHKYDKEKRVWLTRLDEKLEALAVQVKRP